MARDIVYFDLETQRSFNDVGGPMNTEKLGLSLGVTFSTANNQYRIFLEKDVEALIEQILQADLVVGFHHVGFDYRVLQAYTILDLASQTVNCDLSVHIHENSGQYIKLDNIAGATIGSKKTAEGLQAIRWWREGNLTELAKYCAYDVKVTKCIHEFGREHGHVKFLDSNGAKRQINVNWK